MNQTRGALCLWLTGLSGAGKTTLCRALESELRTAGRRVRVLDSEALRRTVNRDLGFSAADRDENVARIAVLARDLVRQGHTVLVAAISPYAEARAHARAVIESAGRFLEVFVDAPLSRCIRRDPKGHYTAALAGRLPNFTGIDGPYEAPCAPDVHLNTSIDDPAACVAAVLAAVNGTAAHFRLAVSPPVSA